MNPDLDLSLDRIIRAPRSVVWDAWTDPASLASWWLPAPTQCRVERLDTVPGGAFVTSMSEDGIEFVPHLDACFLAVDAGERIVFTNAVDSRWRPAAPEPVSMTAEIILRDHPDGTDYRVIVRHGDPASRARHEELGFVDGWGTVTAAARRAGRATRRCPMRLTLTQFVTLDGVYQGPGSPDEDPSDGFTRGGWMVPHMDETFIAQAAAWLARADALLLGRRTYEAFAEAWPQITDPDDPFTERMNGLPKYVASHTLTDATWSPSTILRGDIAAQVAAAQGPAGTRAPAARLGPTRPERCWPPA